MNIISPQTALGSNCKTLRFFSFLWAECLAHLAYIVKWISETPPIPLPHSCCKSSLLIVTITIRYLLFCQELTDKEKGFRRFTPTDFVKKCRTNKYKLGLIIDLTNTSRYNNSLVCKSEILNHMQKKTNEHECVVFNLCVYEKPMMRCEVSVYDKVRPIVMC